MDPVREAKERVAQVFVALQPAADTTWRELVRGGYEAYTGLCGGVLTGYVSVDGYYEVYAGKQNCPRMVCLMAGSMVRKRAVVSDTPEAAENVTAARD